MMPERFWNKIHPEPNSGCWIWTGATHRQGYGHFALSSGHTVLAHRASWFFTYGQMPSPDIKVCHRCDMPACVNPDHLFLGTQKDNAIDCVLKGRARRGRQPGETNPRAVLRADQVRHILRDTRTHREIASDYGCSESTVSMIKRGQNWRDLFTEWQSAEATKRAEMRL